MYVRTGNETKLAVRADPDQAGAQRRGNKYWVPVYSERESGCVNEQSEGGRGVVV